MRRVEVDEGRAAGRDHGRAASGLRSSSARIAELRRANEILKSASLFFAAELDGRTRK